MKIIFFKINSRSYNNILFTKSVWLTVYSTVTAHLYGTVTAHLYGTVTAHLYGTVTAHLYGTVTAHLYGTLTAHFDLQNRLSSDVYQNKMFHDLPLTVLCYNKLTRYWSLSVITQLFKCGLILILSSRISGLQAIMLLSSHLFIWSSSTIV
jgi:hypothetical protein